MKINSAGFFSLGVTLLAMSVAFAGVAAAGFVFRGDDEGMFMASFASIIALVFGMVMTKVAVDPAGQDDANG